VVEIDHTKNVIHNKQIRKDKFMHDESEMHVDEPLQRNSPITPPSRHHDPMLEIGFRHWATAQPNSSCPSKYKCTWQDITPLTHHILFFISFFLFLFVMGEEILQFSSLHTYLYFYSVKICNFSCVLLLLILM